MYFGNGGYDWATVYNMPIWLRKFNIHRINEHLKKEEDAAQKARGESNIGDGEISRPNIDTSSQFYFNKD